MLDKTINLLPHNENCYIDLLTSLDKYPLAILERATGTGKSYILLKYLYEKMRNKRILFISMHDEMFTQLFEEQMPDLGLSKEDFYKFDTLIYPNILKMDPQEIIANYDCIIIDEAHHCGAPKWSKKILELKELVLNSKDKVMIGATATKTRYLDNYKDVAEIYFDNHIVGKLPVSTSILENLLPAPLYINSKRACLEKIERIINKISKIPHTSEIISIINHLEGLKRSLIEENSIPNTLKEYNVKPGDKYIVFCRNIKDIERKKKEVELWFKDISPIKIFTAHSKQKKEKNKEEINEFSKSRKEISLMLAVDIFNEGFHINGVDGILMFRKTKSPIIYFQQIGRALSFQVRKSQIKIFDFVDNYNESEVIFNLYKEVIAEAKRLTTIYPENKTLYEEIISRFEIIDETTKILEDLKKIEELLEEKYIVKNHIEKAILTLEEYRIYNKDSNFNEELTNNNLDYKYIKAFNYLCSTIEYLTLEDIKRLSNLNIYFNNLINKPISIIKKELKGFNTYKELKEAQFKEFLTKYLSFYNKYKRRPNPDNSLEQSLYKEYRLYLEILPLSKLKKMINYIPDIPTIEEKILIGGYPSIEEITDYLEYLISKIEGNHKIDSIELKVLRRLKRTFNLKNVKITNFLKNIDDINILIDQSITILSEYKKTNTQETFSNIDNFTYDKIIYSALKNIYRYSKRITTKQFKKLLELNIKLPSDIDMTLEERLSILGSFNSFYELEQKNNINILDEYILYIIKYQKRPSTREELHTRYIKYIKNTTVPKLKEICNILKSHNIELLFYEKVITGEPIEENTIITYIFNIKIKLSQDIIITKEELKILRAILHHNYLKDNEELKYLIHQIININTNEDLINKLVNQNNQTEKNNLIRKLTDNSKYLTKRQLNILKSINIDIPSIIEDTLKSSNSINLYEHEQKNNLSFIKEFFKYLEDNHKRPPKSNPLNNKYREYIAKVSKKKITTFITRLLSNNISLTIEEKILTNQEYSTEEPSTYQEYISNKLTSNIPLDSLERRVYNIIKRKLNITKSTNNKKLESSDHIESIIIESLRKKIRLNPQNPIDYYSGIYNISYRNRNYLEQERINILCHTYFLFLISLLKKEKKPLTSILSAEELIKFKKYAEYDNLNSDNLKLLCKINYLDNENKYLIRGMKKEDLLSKYLLFIKLHNGLRPNINSEIEEESILASQYSDIIKDNLLSQRDLQLINKTIIEESTKDISESFYQAFITFIELNGRFPCGNSDDPNEVRLNNLYTELGSNLSKEEKNYIRKLKSKYKEATLQANISFSKRIK